MSSLFLIGSVVAAAMMFYYDSALQNHRADDAPAAAFLLVPFRWFSARLYHPKGQRVRKRVLIAFAAMVVCALLALITS